jgi:hypothetical protein
LSAGPFKGHAAAPRFEASGPLAGYQLSCVTFGMPPVAGSATADSNGMLTLTLDAANVPFGCFIIDPNGEPVATVEFTSGSTSSFTVSFSQSGSLGTVTVDLSTGLAQVVLTGSGVLVTGTPTTTCPLGTWTDATGILDSCGTQDATVWVARLPSGQHTVSYIVGPVDLGDAGGGGCGNRSVSNLAASYSNGQLTFTAPDDNSGCSARSTIVTFTPDALCHSATVELAFTGCGTCGAPMNGVCSGCGTETCMITINPATRQ